MGDVVSIFKKKKTDRDFEEIINDIQDGLLECEKSLNKAKEEQNNSFEDIMKRNNKTKERMRRDRNKDNKSVLRSYRIKT